LLIWSIEISNFFSMFLIFIDLAFCLTLLIHFTLILLTSQLCQCINLSVIYFQLGKFLWKLTAPHRINYTQFEVHNPKCCYTTFIPSIQQLGDQDLWIQSPTAINRVFPKVEISGKFCSKFLLAWFIPCMIC
jgi:hypothetical protein